MAENGTAAATRAGALAGAQVLDLTSYVAKNRRQPTSSEPSRAPADRSSKPSQDIPAIDSHGSPESRQLDELKELASRLETFEARLRQLAKELRDFNHASTTRSANVAAHSDLPPKQSIEALALLFQVTMQLADKKAVRAWGDICGRKLAQLSNQLRA